MEMEKEPIKEEVSVVDMPHNRGQKIATGLLLVGLCVVLAYAFREHSFAKQIAASRDELTVALNQERGQVETLTQKLNAAESVPAAAPQPALNSQTEAQAPITESKRVQRHSTRHAAVLKAHRAEDPWRKEVQSELTEQQKQLAEHQQQLQETRESVARTRTELESDLNSTRDDLNGSIAKNHEELVALEKKGERHYSEFNLQKSKQFQKAGPISISLRKSNAKHEYCDLVMIVNDSEVSKKHVDLYEPVLFYPEGFSQPLEVVINSIGKDAARGYISEPKYKPSELAASASSSSGTGPVSADQTVHSSSAEAATLKRRAEPQE
jgi:type II secretory pathway component PulM